MRRITSEGSGPAAAVLVHGNDLCAEFYQPLAGELASRGVSTTLTTLPGFASEAPLPEPTWDRLSELVAGLVAETEGAPRALIGHSMGGLIALLAAARAPRGLTHLVLLEPAVFPSRWTAKAGARRYLRNVVHGDRARFHNWTGAFRRIASPEAYPQDKIDLYLSCRQSAHVDTVDRLFRALPRLYPLPWRDLGIPVLLVTGAATGWRGRMLARALGRRIPG